MGVCGGLEGFLGFERYNNYIFKGAIWASIGFLHSLQVLNMLSPFMLGRLSPQAPVIPD